MEISMLDTYEKNSKMKLMTTVVAVLVIAGVVVIADHLKGKTSASNTALVTPATTSQTSTSSTPAGQTPTTTTGTSSATTGSSVSSSGYKDGTYSATSDYYVPPGQESIKVNLTLSNGTITTISIQNSEGDRDSALFQENFASEYKQYVVGKKIDSLRLSVIAGASDTTQGFVDALSQIASKAQA